MRVVGPLVWSLLVISLPSLAAPLQKEKGAAGTAVMVIVTDKSGNRLAGVQVTAVGTALRDGVTTDEGQARLTGLEPGSYRLRFEADGFIPFEREVVIREGQVNEVRAALSAMTARHTKPPPEPKKAPPPPPEKPSEPTSVVVDAFLDKNRIEDDDPNRRTQIGCTSRSSLVLHQLNDLLEEQVQKEADTILTVVEGEGVLRLGEARHALAESMVVVIPPGIPYSIKREGRDPLAVLLALAGAPCVKRE